MPKNDNSDYLFKHKQDKVVLKYGFRTVNISQLVQLLLNCLIYLLLSVVLKKKIMELNTSFVSVEREFPWDWWRRRVPSFVYDIRKSNYPACSRLFPPRSKNSSNFEYVLIMVEWR